MTIADAFHYDQESRERITLSYPAHVRRARAMGLPAIGEGAIYPISDEFIMCEPFDIPPHWMEIGGLDFGWDHPTAAVRLVFNREEEMFYVTATYRKRQETPLYHANQLKGWGLHLPFAWGTEGLQTKLTDNPEQTFKMFRKHGLKMLDTHATFSSGGVGVEQGVQEIFELMQSGRFKVFAHLSDWFEEKNSYHRFKNDEDKVAQIKKVHDDLMDATRYAWMMIRHAVPVSWRKRHGGRPRPATVKKRDTRDIF